VARTLIVSILHISDRVAEKIADDDHRLDPDEVRAAIEDVGRLPFRWNFHPERGWRAYVFTVIRNESVQVTLYPSRSGNAEEWHLGSAYPEEPPT
jgi:hypothetical protein